MANRSTPWPFAGGDMATFIQGHDWGMTALGPFTAWPQSLKTVVETLLVGGFPAVALWGIDLIQIYNDGYRLIMGDKHPAGLGQATRDCWPEVWHINEPIYQRILTGETLVFEDKLYPIARKGPLEDAWFTLSYSPLRDDGSAICGVLVTVVEVTARRLAERGRETSEQRLRALVNATSYSIYCMSPDWSEMRRLDGRGFISDTPSPSSAWLEEYIHPDDQAEVTEAIQQAIGGKTMFQLEHRVRRVDGSLGWTLSRAIPLVDELGEVTEWFGAASDITANRRAQDDLRSSEQKLRRVLETEAVGVLFFDLQGTVIDANDSFLKMTGYSRAQVEQRQLDWRRMTPPEWVAVSEEHMQKVLSTGRVGPYEKEYFLADGSRRWMLFAGREIGDGSIVEYCIDISDRRRSEEKQKLLMGELNHRVRNTLASVQAIAQQTLRRAKTPEEFVTSFSGRIQSLSKAHGLLSATTWEGADLEHLIEGQALQGPVDGTMVTMGGPQVTVGPEAAVRLSLMIHELATNSSKHGALSNGKGTVAVSWRLDGNQLELRWLEHGGPPVVATGRRGFGMELIERSARSEGGDAKMSLDESGVSWIISLPLQEVITPQPAPETSARAEVPVAAAKSAKLEKPLLGLRVLVVEDEPLLSLDIVAMLEDAGAEKINSVSTAAAALRAIRAESFGMVLLDGNLGGESVEPVAKELRGKKIPFVFVTGYGRESLPKGFSETPMIGKPFEAEQLVEAVRSLRTAKR